VAETGRRFFTLLDNGGRRIMAKISAEDAQQQAVRAAASLMAAAARTAPKTRGLDSTETLILDGEDLEILAKAMEAKVTEQGKGPTFIRDAKNVRAASAVLLIGVTGEPKNPKVPLDCGACGYPGCAEFIEVAKSEGEDFRGPLCIYQVMDLGIALGSAAKTAGLLNIDNRIMYSLGAAARKLKLLNADVIIGFPLSVSGKSPYFDR
jgi:uncharacterized ferredoxin-like protein